MKVSILSPLQAQEAVDVLCDAFSSYPVMRYVIGPPGPDFERRLRTLLDFFVAARFLGNDLVLSCDAGDGVIAGVATVTLPGGGDPPEELAQRRKAVWRRLGEGARMRYEAQGEALREFELDQPHYHLNLIGVRPSHRGRGLGRRLLEEVHRRSARDPVSCGVTLNTEDPLNVALYQRFGYRVLGHAHVSGELESWYMFREGGGP